MKPAGRKATPDSEAVASSEDEKPWPSAPSFGSLPRKENGVSGFGGGIWSQKSSSFKMEKTAQRNAAREALLAAPNQGRGGLKGEQTPSPAVSDGSGALPFAIPSDPPPKAGRSLSHSQGQREFPMSSGANEHAIPLGLLTEEVDTETDSELGGGITQTTSHPPFGSSLHRTATYPPTFETFYDEDEPEESAEGAQKGERKFESAFNNLSLEHSQRRSQWQSHLGWDDVPNINESRRHSLADMPTRRGSLAGTDHRSPLSGQPFWQDGLMYEWQNGAQSHAEQTQRDAAQRFEFGGAFSGPNSAKEASSHSETIDAEQYDKDNPNHTFDIPSMYKPPFVRISAQERSELEKRERERPPIVPPHAGMFAGGRPRKQLFIVSFKCSRVDVFYLLENTGLQIKEGDLVIVEADRGQDLGTVQHAAISSDDARLFKRKYGEEQYKWLMMFSKHNQKGSVNPNAQVYGENADARRSMLANAPATMQGLPRDHFNSIKPKAIKRLANDHEIRMLREKEGNEAKAKRTCQQKVAHLHLDMEILDAEWQWDFQKLIFYYYADHYINFKDLITELYRIYKTRIWLSAINPASFSQHALGQPPSGIGPGAISDENAGLNNSYMMSYGQDPDPYGAIPPYRIGYETYTPNYPGIPGVANSFAPPGAPGMPPFAPFPVGENQPPLAGLGQPPNMTPAAARSHAELRFGTRPNARHSNLHPNAPQPIYSPQQGGNVPHVHSGRSISTLASEFPQQHRGGVRIGNELFDPDDLVPYTTDFHFTPGNAGAIGQGLVGLGRETYGPAPRQPYQLPIGTRPDSTGNTTQTQTARPTQNTPPANATRPPQQPPASNRPSLLSRIGVTAPDFVPQQQAAGPLQMGWASDARGGLSSTAGDRLNRGGFNFPAPAPTEQGGFSGVMMHSWLDSLQKNEDTHADEMSRER